MAMDWNRSSSRGPQTISVDGHEYFILPVPDDGSGNNWQSRFQRSELQRFDSKELKTIAEFPYDALPKEKRRIRLLQLRSGTTHGPEIFCRLIPADYDDEFHVLVKAAPPPDSQSGDNREVNGISAANGGSQDLVQPAQAEQRANGASYADGLWRSVENTKEAGASDSHKEEFGEVGPELPPEPFESAKQKQEREKKEREKKERELRLKRVRENEIKYEALSWCWGTEDPIYAIQIEYRGTTYKKKVTRELALALKYLRLPDKERTLWIDAICINQDDHNERNHQVQMMSRIYTRAKEVAIWLGEDNHDSTMAINFIHEEIIKLQNFDALCSDKMYSDKWRALMMLMQRDWFSRRWVVQEIALASDARIYCGPDSISWNEFAVAVELFVEVESATHRLSEIMQKDEKFRHVPGWFEHISELGASLLVQATGKVFRAQRMPIRESGLEGTHSEPSGEIREPTIDPLDRRSLLSLEYLVTTMFIFKATEPRDAVYALLAIARDAAPYAKSDWEGDSSTLIASVMEHFLEEKPFMVDYSRPYSDVCRDFVEFVIRRKNRWDPVQALDVLCRPWALEKPTKKSIRLATSKPPPDTNAEDRKKRDEKEKERLRPRRDITPRQIYTVQVTPGREGSSPLTWSRKYMRRKRGTWVDETDLKGYKEMAETLQSSQYWRPHPDGWESVKKYFPQSEKGDQPKGGQPEETKEIDLPSWVTLASRSPFSLYPHPGVHVTKMGRANADSLVGHPQDGHRNYSAAQTNPVDLRTLKFRKRQMSRHYSLYIRGFKMDEVKEVLDASQGGNIPKSWLDLAGWTDHTENPPDAFWRTIVADRGRDNRNPPYYFMTACKESVRKGGIASGRVNTADLINNERNSIVAEFCRRVQSVIWGRRLFMTERGALGLATNVQKGDHVCVLYGLTVPVILHGTNKGGSSDSDKILKILKDEDMDDAVESLRSCMRRMVGTLERKRRYEKKKKEDPTYEATIRQALEDARAWERKHYGKRLPDDKLVSEGTSMDTQVGGTSDTATRKSTTEGKRKSQATEPHGEDQEPPRDQSESLRRSLTHKPSSWQATQNDKEKSGLLNLRKAVTSSFRNHFGGSRVESPGERASPSSTAQSINEHGSEGEDGQVDPQNSLRRRNGPHPVENTPPVGTSVVTKRAPNMPTEVGVDTVEADRNWDEWEEVPPPKLRPMAKQEPSHYPPIKDEEKEEGRKWYYEFKGEAYVHGMMDGEALRDKFYRGVPDTLFEIR